MADETEYKTVAEFWPYYLSEHLSPVNRWLHVVGSLGGLVWLAAAAYLQQPWFILAGVLNGYAFAWIGHFVIEKNRPATFKYPLKSFLCDWIMIANILTGRIGKKIAELEAPGTVVSPAPQTETAT
jgi:hypothetical protein